MYIKFKVIFSDRRIAFVEYVFNSWKAFSFDIIHYNQDEVRTDSKLICNFSVRKAIRNLIENCKKNKAQIKLILRTQE